MLSSGNSVSTESQRVGRERGRRRGERAREADTLISLTHTMHKS